MMLGELERVTEGRGGGVRARVEGWGLHTLVAPAPLIGSSSLVGW